MLLLESGVAFQLTVYVCVHIDICHVADFVFQNLKLEVLFNYASHHMTLSGSEEWYSGFI